MKRHDASSNDGGLGCSASAQFERKQVIFVLPSPASAMLMVLSMLSDLWLALLLGRRIEEEERPRPADERLRPASDVIVAPH